MIVAPEDWKPADGLKLEPNALKAVKEQHKSIALTAGPGAGKTEMLAQRADFLLRTRICSYPYRLLAISFKIDASRNLRDRVRKRCGPILSARFDSNTFHAFAKRLIDRFRLALPPEDALDADYTIGDTRYGTTQIAFDDLVPFALEILQRSDVARNAVRQTYTHVFLDEFQDCTTTQFKLVREAFEGTGILLTAVGDTKQRIMSWAGALEGVFAKFATRFGAVGLNLYQNYRSAPRLRRMQNAMVKVLEPAAAVPDDELKGDAGIIEIFAFEDSAAEASSLSDLIADWIQVEHIPPAEIAVLMSKQVDHYAEHLIMELQHRKIAFRNEQKLQDISAEPIARIIVDFLLVVCGEREPEAYTRLMDAFALSTIDEEGDFRARLQRYLDESRVEYTSKSALDPSSLASVVDKFLKQLGLEATRALCSEYERGDYLKKKIEETIERITELWDTTSDLLTALRRFSEDLAVRIMTIHKSKGLEFDSVILLAVEEETFFGKVREERSVFFVGISRAKRRLILTTADRRPTPSGNPRRWAVTRRPQKEFLSYAGEAD